MLYNISSANYHSQINNILYTNTTVKLISFSVVLTFVLKQRRYFRDSHPPSSLQEEYKQNAGVC